MKRQLVRMSPLGFNASGYIVDLVLVHKEPRALRHAHSFNQSCKYSSEIISNWPDNLWVNFQPAFVRQCFLETHCTRVTQSRLLGHIFSYSNAYLASKSTLQIETARRCSLINWWRPQCSTLHCNSKSLTSSWYAEIYLEPTSSCSPFSSPVQAGC